MTKITSIEERVEKLLENETDEAMDFFPTAPVVAKQTVVLILTQALTAQRTALLTELRDSGLLEEKVNHFRCITLEAKCDGHNTLARAIKDHINNLINPSV